MSEDDYAWVDKGDGRQVYRRVRRGVEAPRSDLPCPMLISDYIEIKSMVDGEMYSSKAALRRSYRERGYVEVGNEELKPTPKPKPDRQGVKASVRRAASRVGIPV